MHNKETDELFELIHSLSKAERRYFKLHFEGNAHSDVQKYTRLFDAIAAMSVFDKSALEKKFKGEQIIKYYSKTKAYMVDAILDALRAFRRGQSPVDDINLQAANIRILIAKGLHAQAEHAFATTKQLCYDTEQLVPLLDILDTEETYRVALLQDRSAIHTEFHNVISLIQEREHMAELHHKVYSLYSKYGLRPTPEAKQEFVTYLELLNTELSKVRLNHSVSLCNSTIAICHHSLGQHYEAYKALCANVELYETKITPKYFRARAIDFLRVLGNIITYAYNTRNLETFTEAQELVRSRMEKVAEQEELKFGIIATQIFLEISLRGNFDMFLERVQYVEEHQDVLAKVGTVIQSDIVFNVSLGYLKTHRPDDAIRWLMKLFEVPKFEERTQIYIYARMYEILLHWRLNNTDLVISRTLSYKRYLTKRDIMGELEKAIVKFINAATYNNSTKGFEKAMNAFGVDLEQLAPTQYSGMVAHYSDLLKWFTVESLT